MSTPRLAAAAMAHVVGTGAASTSAHGHASTSRTRAVWTHAAYSSASSAPRHAGTTTPTTTAMSSTRGVQYIANVSMRAWVLVVCACASVTAAMMAASVDSSASRVSSTSMYLEREAR